MEEPKDAVKIFAAEVPVGERVSAPVPGNDGGEGGDGGEAEAERERGPVGHQSLILSLDGG